MKNYNVWYVSGKRWTNTYIPNLGKQDPKHPYTLTLEQAITLHAQVVSTSGIPDSSPHFLVRELLADGSAGDVIVIGKTDSIGPAVNDHTCLWCKNERCSRTEKSCWKCGNPL